MATPRRGDESFTLAGVEYPMMFPHAGGHQGFVSASPFAPKSQLGERTYNDYTAFSVVAFTNFAGGMGQERIGDATKYYDAVNMDARSGQLIMGPAIHYTDATNLVNYTPNPLAAGTPEMLYCSIRTENYAVACRFTGSGQTTRHVWLPLAGTLWGKKVTLEVWSCSALVNEPDALLVAGSFNVEDISEKGAWACATLASSITLTSSTTYWIVCYVDALPATVTLPDEMLKWIAWWNADDTDYDYMTVVRSGSSSWFPLGGYGPIFWIPDETAVDKTPILFLGAGEDGVSRVWSAAGRHLYYYDEDSLPIVVLDAAGGSAKDIGGEAVCAIFYRADADTSANIYIGLGGESTDPDLVKFNGSIGDETWPVISGVKAHAMCLHDGLLWLANDRNKVQGWNTTTLGGNCSVGNSDYVIRNMVSWNSYLWVGKDDGLYRVVVPDGYPTTGDPEAQKVIDFAPLADTVNFSAMCVHQGELFFNINQGIMRYTSGGVLTPISPEIGLELSADARATCRALCTTLTSMWALMESPFRRYGYSALLSYNDGAWHPICQTFRFGDLTRSMLVEPGWYDGFPRIWFASALCTAYTLMPFGTLRRWLWDDLDEEYQGSSYITTSWIDGGLRTVTKDWINATVDLIMPTDDTPPTTFEITIEYRTSEDDTWHYATVPGSTATYGGATTTGVSTFVFPTNSYSARVQLRIGIVVSAPQDLGTPRIAAVILKYMERPDDLQQFTRTYEISSNQSWRNGIPIRENLSERLAWVRTLRESAEPLAWTDWTGTQRNAHIIDYNASENPEVRGDLDTGTITITCRLQVI